MNNESLAIANQAAIKAMAEVHTRAEILDTLDDLLDLSEYTSIAARLASARLSNLDRFSERYHFIPLGEDCFGRSILHQLGYKKSKAEGEPSYPFDLSITPCLSASQLIASNFSDFMNPRYLTWNSRHPGHGRYQIEFNHEQGNHFHESNFKRLRQRYAKRVHNFYKNIASGKIVVYVIHNYHANKSIEAAQLKHLSETLQSQKIKHHYRLIYIDTSKSFANGVENIGARISRISLAPPKDYIWHENSHRYSKSGMLFTINLNEQIRSVMATIEP